MTTFATDATDSAGPSESLGGAFATGAAQRAVDARRLLARTRDHRWPRSSRLRDAAMRATLIALLRRVRRDQFVVSERLPGRPASTMRFGNPGELSGEIVVHDTRAYAAVMLEGSIGLGRGYLEGWWSTDDPVAVVQVIIRNLDRLDRYRNGWERATGPLSDRIRRALPRHTRDRNKDDIGAHYDIGNDFFALFLDDTMTYSSAIFPTPDATLLEASRHKYDVLLRKLGVTEHHHLLEIGTGWGGMAIRAATTIECRVTTTTISDEQLREATRRVADAGVRDRVTLLGDDWRDLTAGELAGTYDRLVSIEMIEAVDWRDYDEFFSTIERCLAPDGLAAIQAICLPDSRWERAKNTEDFIRRFVFPNGFLPSIGAIERAVHHSTRMRVVDVHDITPHYAETLRRWRERFDEQLDEVLALGLDARFTRLWRFYLAYCEAGFRERHCTVAQLVLAGEQSDLAGERSR